jgi:hypothetical protein
MSEEQTEAAIVYHELHAVVKRYISEGNALSTFGVIGALEAVKTDVLDMLARHNARTHDGDHTDPFYEPDTPNPEI